jgi:hypothetical protein
MRYTCTLLFFAFMTTALIATVCLTTFLVVLAAQHSSLVTNLVGQNATTHHGLPSITFPRLHRNPTEVIAPRSDTALSLSDTALIDTILNDLNTTASRIHSASKDLDATASLSPRDFPPTVADCTPNGPVCRLSVLTWDSPGHNTAVLGIFDYYCNLIGYYDHAPYGQIVDFYSQLPYTVVTRVNGVNDVVFKYDGVQFGTGWSEAICWEDPAPQFGKSNPSCSNAQPLLGQSADSINRFPGLLCRPFLVPTQVMVH